MPDHSTFSKNRHGRFRESDLFRQLFEQVVRMCMQAGLVGGEGFAIDASVIEADAGLRRKAEGKLTAWPEAEDVSRPVREYLDALDQAAAAEAKPATNADDDMPPGNPPSEPQVTSLTDPAAAWTSKGRSKLCFAYGTNYLIDNKLAIIVDVEATPARWQVEVAATKTMLERTKGRFGLHPQRLAADTAYGSGLMIGWLMRRGIEPHVPLLDRERQTRGFFTKADFKFDDQTNTFTCPGGKALKSNGLVRDDGTVRRLRRDWPLPDPPEFADTRPHSARPHRSAAAPASSDAAAPPHVIFEIRDCPGDRGRRTVQPPRCPRQAAFVDCGNEGLNRVNSVQFPTSYKNDLPRIESFFRRQRKTISASVKEVIDHVGPNGNCNRIALARKQASPTAPRRRG